MIKVLSIFLLSLWGAASSSAVDQSLSLAAPFTDNMILQRQTDVPVWGFDTPSREITVSFAGQTKTAVADKNGEWMLKLTPLKASEEERDLEVKSSNGTTITLKGVLVGEVWFSSGQSNMVWTAGKSMCRDIANEIAKSEKEIPIREININTVSALYPQKQATSDEGWKTASGAGNFSALSLSFAYDLYKELNISIGIVLSAHSNTRTEAFAQLQAIEAHPNLKGDTDLMLDADPLTEQEIKGYEFAKTLDCKGVPQGFISMASPLSWTSFKGVEHIKNPKFKSRLDELFLQYPNSEVARTAVAKHVNEVKAFVNSIKDAKTPQDCPLIAPTFPQPGKSEDVKPDMAPTYTYNWCVSPVTPIAESGVIWVSSEANIGHTSADYAAELEIYAKSLSQTYGQKEILFLHTQPTSSLVEGITKPNLPVAKSTAFDQWPKSLKKIVADMANQIK